MLVVSFPVNHLPSANALSNAAVRHVRHRPNQVISSHGYPIPSPGSGGRADIFARPNNHHLFIIFIISSLDARLGTAVDFRGIWHDRSHPPTECLEVHASTLMQT